MSADVEAIAGTPVEQMRTSDLLLWMNYDRVRSAIIAARPMRTLGFSPELQHSRTIDALECIAAEVDRRIPVPEVKP